MPLLRLKAGKQNKAKSPEKSQGKVMFSGKIEIKAPEELVNAYLSSLEPEQDFKTERAKYFLKKSKGKLVIEVNAQDASAFRAAMNTITGLISIVDKNWKRVKDL